MRVRMADPGAESGPSRLESAVEGAIFILGLVAFLGMLLLPVSVWAQNTLIVQDGTATVVSVGTQGPAGANIPAGGSEGLVPAKVGAGFGWSGLGWNAGISYTFDLPIIGKGAEFTNTTAETDQYHWWWTTKDVAGDRAVGISDTNHLWLFNGHYIVFSTGNPGVSGAHLFTLGTTFYEQLASSLYYKFQIDNAAATTTVNVEHLSNFQDSPVLEISRLAVGPPVDRAASRASSATLNVYDATATTGSTLAIIKAGAGQSQANLQEWQNNAGGVLAKVGFNGYIYTSNAAGTLYSFLAPGSLTSNADLYLYPAGSGQVYISGNNGTSYLRFDNNYFIPDSDATRFIGHAGYRFRGGYFGGNATSVPIIIKLHASQTANALEVQNSGGTPITSITKDGMVTLVGIALASLGTPANGTIAYCSDCAPQSNPCTATSTGAFAHRLNGAWDCR